MSPNLGLSLSLSLALSLGLSLGLSLSLSLSLGLGLSLRQGGESPAGPNRPLAGTPPPTGYQRLPHRAGWRAVVCPRTLTLTLALALTLTLTLTQP